MRTNLDLLSEIEQNGDFSEFLKKDDEFHQLIIAAAKNRYISDIYEQYKNKLTFYRRMLVHEDNLQSICKKHEQIFYWIVERNEEKARQAMENHVTINLKMIAKNG